MDINPHIQEAFAPTGILRASINTGNPILARMNSEAQQPYGVSIDLAHELAKALELPLELIVFDAAGKSVQAVTDEHADIGFFAVDPLRGQGIGFTAPYVLIEGAYLVKESSFVRDMAEVDQLGTQVVVGKGSAYDLFLTREFKHAEIYRAPTSPTVVDVFLEQEAEVAAGVKQQLEADAARLGGLRLLPGHFMVIQQAMGLPKGRGEVALGFLRAFVERMKASGFVADTLRRHGIEGASVAPASKI